MLWINATRCGSTCATTSRRMPIEIVEAHGSSPMTRPSGSTTFRGSSEADDALEVPGDFLGFTEAGDFWKERRCGNHLGDCPARFRGMRRITTHALHAGALAGNDENAPFWERSACRAFDSDELSGCFDGVFDLSVGRARL